MEIFWYIVLMTMLAVYVILDGYDFGAGIIHLFFAKKEKDKKAITNAIGPFWDANEVWLIASGGVLFFAFPQQEPATEWVDVLHTFSGFRIPQAPKEWFFEDDVIHLNPKGHRELAKAIRASLADASMLPPVH